MFASHGTIDAGVRAHDVFVGAQFVLNADNTAGAVSKMADIGKSNDGNQDNASLIIVEVLGYGACSGADAEACAKQ